MNDDFLHTGKDPWVNFGAIAKGALSAPKYVGAIAFTMAEMLNKNLLFNGNSVIDQLYSIFGDVLKSLFIV